MNELGQLGILLILAGFAVIFAGMLLTVIRGGGKGGGVILIGPFPIVFGSDAKTVKGLLWIVIILMVVLIVLNLAFAYPGWRSL